MVGALPIPVEALDDRLAFVGTSGSGKTYAAGTAVERLLRDRKRVGVVDPLGVWWGLRLLANGKEPSVWPVVIFGGPHADIAITAGAGALIGETVAGMKESFIVDLSELGTKSNERRFMLGFLEALYRKASGEPFHLVVDEADLFAPQKTSEPALQSLMEQIVRRGRVKGFIPWLITQRPAVISKDVLSQADGLVAMKLTASQDRDALGAWIEGQGDKVEEKRILAALPTLSKGAGEGFVWIPGRGILERAKFPTKVSFDSSQTPKRGEKRVSRALKPLDVEQLRGRLATVEQEVASNDPTKLRARVNQLEKQLRSVAPPADPAALVEAERRGYASGKVAGIGIGLVRARRALDQLQIADVAEESGDNERGEKALRSAQLKKLASEPVGADQRAAPNVQRERAPVKLPAPSAVRGAFTGPQTKILRGLAMWRSLGQHAPSRHQLAAVCGYSHPRSSGFRNPLSELCTAGAISYGKDGSVVLTEGIEAPEMSIEEGRTHFRAALSGPQLKLINLLEHGEFAREDLAVQAGYGHVRSSGFRNPLSELHVLDIVEYPEQGRVCLAAWMSDLLPL